MTHKVLLRFFGILLLGASAVFATYIERIDTSDTNGYGLDSAFRIANNSITGQYIIRYHINETSTGYFNQSFSDIKMAPDSNKSAATLTGLYCFVIKNDLNATYSKVQILNQLPDKRFVFKYGSNTTPTDRVLEQPAYDRSIRYKPNNFHNYFQYYCNPSPIPLNNICQQNTSSWDPPLPNNNHLLGYIYYMAKFGADIDTTAPINIVQWDSIAFLPSNTRTYIFSGQPSQYYNIVAVYSEGKSDFLQGWSRRVVTAVGVEQNPGGIKRILNIIETKKVPDGFLFTFQPFLLKTGSPSLFIYTVNGKKSAGFPDLKTNNVYWKTKDQNLAIGPYIIKLESADKTVLTHTLIISRD